MTEKRFIIKNDDWRDAIEWQKRERQAVNALRA